MGRYAEAEGFYQQQLTLARQLREVVPIKRGFTKLSILAFETTQWARCLEMTKNALTLARLCRDYPSKAHMLLLTARAESQRGNNDVSLNIFEKTVLECERHELNATLAIATRYMVLKHLRHHISLFEWETDQKEKLRSLVRLTRFDPDLDHLTSLSIIAAAKKATSSMSGQDRVGCK
ncbi:unnamed protein product [Strongylus vulgaris]|uniref:MalT-like TPR region domain-containing protein n=1 Tax=Strongylus vulgaris TaxID=40348 RepID=A0A3P7J0B6_STRVU|nr:unnamed protein product [Strongylus vulgaris]